MRATAELPGREGYEVCPHRAHCEPELYNTAMCDTYVSERAGMCVNR